MSISEKKQAWQDTVVAKNIAKAPERKPEFRTTSGIEMERCFTPTFEGYEGYEEKLGFPGQYPFTRGVQPTMYRGRFWTMRQYAGFGTAKESNERYKYLLQAGQTGLSVAFDLPTQMGYDSDAAMAAGEVGKVGVAIDSLADMEVLFDGIPLDQVSTSMTINSTAAILLAMYIAVAEKQGVSADKISGTIQNDILKEYMARGTYIYPPRESMRIITDIFAYCKDCVPKWNTISISGYHIREAGSSAVQEVAFTLADGIAYVDAAIKAGLSVDEFAPRLAFFFNAHNNLLEEVAKFRAARRMWAKIMKERFGAKDPRSMMLRFHTQTAGCTLTAQQPDNNIMRVTIQALAAVLGGTQSLHTNSRDEALALPTEDSVRIALRTQQVIAYESGAADSIDPLAGSFLVESLTDQIEQAAFDYIEKIDRLGGAVEAISRGFQQKEIQDSAYAYQRAIETDEMIIVGVNRFTIQNEPQPELLKIKEEVEIAQKKALTDMKAKRDSAKVQEALKALEAAARGTDNLMPPILQAVKTYATLGEIADVLRGVFGVHRETVVL
ncbi:methylmalonyl-CoA mutase family protein [Geobacter sulfurreducens]|uniref:(R)-methylmalonyl-CoA mutase, isobutyryl-CoA mutase-like catalytic subunit n=1 Tax=Geobacter sulfurreducens (strain ATCC 51573 / DSM 12127 / PCA) TaxID=243231 RepID=Q747G4_GEOSL|nr:methylmalonyl-CoA mutase family protein [Geobacter sulfurreducens]AAR36692.1 (R)-methylmalonyl-CoA mutase, isobutyryl-CoA mutase-like catalytic subunit [Geobacter sulfurreducens PCA]ADI86056.1 (R)-methylmalonyl-CoA mutase, isobutyryl-CoA mutase-like catalytic subunit [Geobacter sulfurreducens KN400]QVW35087.1 methylmalonyl-CoA mutase family protein [Geobacter sulfurreducens]UAC03954.1 methylmalonyl-CoA mutase family protein [Geobacter sulfurreducens]UTG92593.1 methylmalonyl-CoA mutase famil